MAKSDLCSKWLLSVLRSFWSCAATILSKPSHSENQTNKGPLCTTREQIYFSLCLYSSSNTIGTSIWAPFLRHEGNTKSLLPSCIHTVVPPSGTISGSWSEVRAEPTPPCVQRAGVGLPPPHTGSQRPCLCWQLDILAS